MQPTAEEIVAQIRKINKILEDEKNHMYSGRYLRLLRAERASLRKWLERLLVA